MGRAQRERLAHEQELGVSRYRVRRWTAFEWQETDRESRSDREKHLGRVAGIVERRMIDRFPKSNPSVSCVRVDRLPQLLFEIAVDACDEDDARRRATYRYEKALAVKIPTGRGRRQVFSRWGGAVAVPDAVRLRPPWGKTEVVGEKPLRAVG